MTQAAVGAQIDQTLDAHADFATQIAFDRELLHFGTNLLDFGLGQRLDLGRRVHARRGTDQFRPRAADTENTLQSNHTVLLDRQVYACNTRHVSISDEVLRNTPVGSTSVKICAEAQ